MEILNHLKNASGSMAIFMVTELMAYHLLFTQPPPPPNCSKVFELQQSNQGHGKSLGVKEEQKVKKKEAQLFGKLTLLFKRFHLLRGLVKNKV